MSIFIACASTRQAVRWLQHDACAGVILFKRNFVSKSQVAELSAAIREAAARPQLLCVDQEGGRVQRFQEGYSALPPLEAFGGNAAIDGNIAIVGAPFYGNPPPTDAGSAYVFDVTPVPEPSTWALALVAVAASVLMLRTRCRSSVGEKRNQAGE